MCYQNFSVCYCCKQIISTFVESPLTFYIFFDDDVAVFTSKRRNFFDDDEMDSTSSRCFFDDVVRTHILLQSMTSSVSKQLL